MNNKKIFILYTYFFLWLYVTDLYIFLKESLWRLPFFCKSFTFNNLNRVLLTWSCMESKCFLLTVIQLQQPLFRRIIRFDLGFIFMLLLLTLFTQYV